MMRNMSDYHAFAVANGGDIRNNSYICSVTCELDTYNNSSKPENSGRKEASKSNVLTP